MINTRKYQVRYEKIEDDMRSAIDDKMIFIFATTQREFEEKLKNEYNLEVKDIAPLVGGAYCRIEDYSFIMREADLAAMRKRYLAMEDIKSALYYHLSNLEYCYGFTPLSLVLDEMFVTQEDISACGISAKEITDTVKQYMDEIEV